MIGRKMNREEHIAETYLKSLSLGDVTFEPDGNIPPDFSLNKEIAIEVRRLNQHYFSNGKTQGLENVRMPLFDFLNTTLRKFDADYQGNSYWVSVRFHRPIGKLSDIKKEIIRTLTSFLNMPPQLPCNLQVTSNIRFNVFSSQPVEGRVFRFAGGSDRESGGFVLSEFTKNFKYCVEEKTRLTKKYRDKYSLSLLSKII